MSERVMTVKGPIDPGIIGKTMTHEHMLWDQRCWWKGDPEEISLREFVHSKVSIENLGRIYYNAHLHLDNIQQYSPDVAIEEIMHYKKAGGSTVVDVSSCGLGRDPNALLAISEASGVNIVMGSGYYIASAQPDEVKKMNAEEIAQMIVSEFRNGVGYTGVRPGVIGEIGISDFDNPYEIKMLKAAALAQKMVGAALFIHQPIFDTKANAILDIIEAEGVDISKVVMCHCDPTLDQVDYHDSIAKRGAFIEYDQFGLEFLALEGFFLPRDIDRIRAIRKQIDRGNLPRILVSQDVCFKICLVQYGGWGYGHILRDILPIMRREGFSEAEIDTITIDNPASVLAMPFPKAS